jgi:hypothetical protein
MVVAYGLVEPVPLVPPELGSLDEGSLGPVGPVVPVELEPPGELEAVEPEPELESGLPDVPAVPLPEPLG